MLQQHVVMVSVHFKFNHKRLCMWKLVTRLGTDYGSKRNSLLYDLSFKAFTNMPKLFPEDVFSLETSW